MGWIGCYDCWLAGSSVLTAGNGLVGLTVMINGLLASSAPAFIWLVMRTGTDTVTVCWVLRKKSWFNLLL